MTGQYVQVRLPAEDPLGRYTLIGNMRDAPTPPTNIARSCLAVHCPCVSYRRPYIDTLIDPMGRLLFSLAMKANCAAHCHVLSIDEQMRQWQSSN